MHNMLPQMLIDGLTLGAVYALVALGFTMVYGVLEFINFAHGDIFMVGAFVGTEVLLFCKSKGFIATNPVLSLALGFAGAIVFTALLGVAIERIAYRPLRKAAKLVPLVSAFGVSFFLEDFVRMVEALARNAFYLNAPAIFDKRINILGGIEINITNLIVLVLSVVLMALLLLFINKTKIGKAIRAVAQDQTCANLMGIDVNGVIAMTFLVGAGMGGAAGMLFAMQYSLINPLVGFIIGIKGFTAAVFGGIGNIPGSLLGGVILGLAESLGSGYLSILTHGTFGAEYKDVFAFALLIIILIFKPAGLLGKPVSEKV